MLPLFHFYSPSNRTVYLEDSCLGEVEAVPVVGGGEEGLVRDHLLLIVPVDLIHLTCSRKDVTYEKCNCTFFSGMNKKNSDKKERGG